MEANESKKPRRPRIGQIPGAADNAFGSNDNHYEKRPYSAPAADGASAADADSQERRPNFPAREGYPQRPYQPRQSNYGQGGYQQRQGGYSMRMYGEGLSEEEQELWDSMDEDEEELLLEQIRFYRLRERRILIAIASLQEEHQLITGVMRVENKRNFKNASEMERYNEQIEEKVAKGERLAGDAFQMQTMTENSYKRIERLEAELTKVQRAKVEAIGKLADIRKNRSEATGDEAIDDWIKAIMDGDNVE